MELNREWLEFPFPLPASGVATLRVPLPLTAGDFDKLKANLVSVLTTMRDGLVLEPKTEEQKGEN